MEANFPYPIAYAFLPRPFVSGVWPNPCNWRPVQYVGAEHDGILEHREYGPFGNLVEIAGVGNVLSHFPFGFSTKYVDEETGNSYYGFRYYDPENGRWLNRDPIEENGGFNIYGLLSNDALNKRDLFGLAVSHTDFKNDDNIQGYFYFCRPLEVFQHPVSLAALTLFKNAFGIDVTGPNGIFHHCFVAMKCGPCGEAQTKKYWSSFPDRTKQYEINGSTISLPTNTFTVNDARDTMPEAVGEKLSDCDGIFGNYPTAFLMDKVTEGMNAKKIPYFWFVSNSNDTISYAWYLATGGQRVTQPCVNVPGTNFLVDNEWIINTFESNIK